MCIYIPSSSLLVSFTCCSVLVSTRRGSSVKRGILQARCDGENCSIHFDWGSGRLPGIRHL